MARKATVKAAAMSAKRVSALDHVIAYGRHGADNADGPGVKLSLRHPVSMVTVITATASEASINGRALRRSALPTTK